MESSTSQRPKLQKTRSTSSSFRVKKLGRTASKYGSIIEERQDTSSNEDDEERQQSNEQDESEEGHIRTRQPSNHPSERISMNSFDHELTLKDKQDVNIQKKRLN